MLSFIVFHNDFQGFMLTFIAFHNDFQGFMLSFLTSNTFCDGVSMLCRLSRFQDDPPTACHHPMLTPEVGSKLHGDMGW